MLSDEQLSAILDSEERQAIAYQSGELSKQREKSLNYFYGEPLGTEEDGHSKVVVRDVQDTVEAILPALLMKFAGSDQVVEFQPVGPEDEAAAKQRTEYINYVFQQDNPGFLRLYTAFKDALIQKNGVVKVYWDKDAIEEVRTLTDIGDDEYALLVDDPDVEILAHTENPGSEAAAGPSAAETGGAVTGQAVPPSASPATGYASQPPMAAPSTTPGMNGGGMMQAVPGTAMLPMRQPPAPTHDVKYRKVTGKVCVEPIAPEEFLISRRTRDLDKSPYTADRRRKTLSELVSEGYCTKGEALAIGGDESALMTSEMTTRANIDDEGNPTLSDREGVMREVWVTDHYIMVDADEDGIAEMRRFITAGSTRNILLNEEWEGPPPYASGSPILVTHRVIGQSIADQVMDLQLIDSTLLRQALDNLYRTNNPRTYLGTGVNLDDYLNPQPGGYVQVEGDPNERVREATVPFTAEASLPMLEWLRGMREDRTGVTRYNQGSDANSLNKTKGGIEIITNRADMRLDLIARILAETFVKPMFQRIDHCVARYQNKERIIRIRNEWVPIDPRQWESNFDMTVNVGLGTGNKDQMLMHLQMISALQIQAVTMQGGIDGPLVTGPNLYQTAIKITENAGIKNADMFWTDPKKAAQQPQQPPPPDPAMLKAQAEIQAKQLTTQADIQTNQQKTQAQIQLEREKAIAEIMLKAKAQEMDGQLAAQKQQTDTQLAARKQQTDVALATDKHHADMGMAKERMTGEMRIKALSAGAKARPDGDGVDDGSEIEAVSTGFDELTKAMSTLANAMTEFAKAATAERELVRDPKTGQATGSRAKMNGAAQ